MTRSAPFTAASAVDGTPWHLSMGLHRLDLAQWLEVDDRRATELRRKAELLEVARSSVLATLPAGEAPSAELLAAVVEHLRVHHDVVGPEGLPRDATAAMADDAAMHPIEAASRLVQEDLCVLVRDEDHWRLVAACVCFPSRWSLAEKLGASLAGIHGPVPGFERELAAQAGTFFDRLTTARPVWRSNWTLLDTPELHLASPASRRSSGDLADDVGDAMWLRVERQTLRRLEASGAIVFTIRTHVRALGEAVRASPGLADALAATLATVPDDVADYKGWTPVLAPLRAWLAASSATGPPGRAPSRDGHPPK